MRDIGIAVIGWGFMGRTHTHALRSIPLMYPGIDFRPVLRCLCSGHADHARSGMEAAGFESCTDDWRTLLKRDDIQVVSVCTPNALHEEMVTELIRAGKHVYVDKPLTMDAASAKRIRAAARQSGVKVQLVMNNRYLPAILRAEEMAGEGRLGRIIGFHARYLHSGSIDPDKPIGWKQGPDGGVILDLASHALDIACALAGWPESVFCAVNNLYESRPTRDGKREERLTEDHALLTLRLKNGALGLCEASKIATGTNDELTIEINGTAGALRFNSMEPGWLYFFDNTLPEAPLGGNRGFTRIESMARYPAPGGSFLPPKNAIGWDRGHIHCYYSFLDCVAHDKTPKCTLDDALRLQILMDAARESARTGSWVSTGEINRI